MLAVAQCKQMIQPGFFTISAVFRAVCQRKGLFYFDLAQQKGLLSAALDLFI